MSGRQGQAGDGRAQRELQRLERDRVRASDDSLRWVLSDPRGRRFWNDVIHGYLNLSKGCGDVSAQSHRFEGRRLAALELTAWAGRVCAEQLCQADLEAVAARREEYVIRGAILTKPLDDNHEEKEDHDV